MGKIKIEGLEIFANHGVFIEEKNLGQKFILDLELSVNLFKAGKTDDLNSSIHYGLLCEAIEKEFTKKSYDLIEAATYNTGKFIMENYPVRELKIKLSKPWAPVKMTFENIAIEMDFKWSRAIIAFGSNMGDKEKYISEALDKMGAQHDIRILKKSSLIETEPVGYLDQDKFINGAIEVETYLKPKDLLNRLLELEFELKRERLIKWGPRTIDLDIIFYEDLITSDDELILPHPRMEERGFVLEPINEIAPNYVHPLYKKRVSKLLLELRSKSEMIN